MSDFKSINNFWFWCQKVLPLVYDDSISYYEVLCKMSEYLNQVINNVNALPGLIDDKIKEYISSGEIENVLNEMLQNYFPIDVKNPPADLAAAVGDGTTDDTAALQNIINYAAEHNLPIIFPAGVYRVSSLTIAEEGHFLGVGNPTIFKLNNTENALINVEGSFTAFGMTFNANIAGVINPVDAITGTCDNISLSNCTITGCISGVDASVSNIMQIVNCHFSNYTDYGVYVHGAGRILADGIIVDGIANSGAMRFVKIDTSNGIVKNLSSMASVPVGVELTGDFNSVEGRIPNCESPVNDGGQSNNANIIGQTTTLSTQTLTENVSKTYTMSTENHAINSEESVENVNASKTINAADLIINTTNPITYQTPQELNEQFNFITFKDKANNEYKVLVEGENINNFSHTQVNVKDFGAVGDAAYFNNKNMTYWKNASFTETPTDDSAAFESAIEYASAHNIDTIFIPDGYYYLPNFKFSFDPRELRLVGENHSQLISTGLSAGESFITLTGKNALKEYDFPSTPLVNLSVVGTYFINTLTTVPASGVTGVNLALPGTPCHSAMYNVVIEHFNIGLLLTQAYKSSVFNISLIACDCGIYCNTAAIIPFHVYNIYCECCAVGVYNLGTGYETLYITGGAFEYNRVHYNGKSKVVFNSVRFEGDLHSAVDDAGTNATAPFNFSDDSGTCAIFTDCQFLFLENYKDNVTYWVPNIIYNNALVPANIFSCYAPSSTCTYQLIFTNCNYASINAPTSGLLVSIAQGKLKMTGTILQSTGFAIELNNAGTVQTNNVVAPIPGDCNVAVYSPEMSYTLKAVNFYNNTEIASTVLLTKASGTRTAKVPAGYNFVIAEFDSTPFGAVINVF